MRNAFSALLLAFAPYALHAATFVVSNTADSGPGSLRQAIADSNAMPGLDTIDFSIGTGPQTIDVASTLVVTSPIIIDGATQDGYTGTPVITLLGPLVGPATGNGLDFAAGADGSAVRNLELAHFLGFGFFDAAAIAITGANNVSITGNYIGGVRVVFFYRNSAGIRVFTDSNIVGGLTAAERNVFVNVTLDIHLMPTADGNVIRGNYFGFDAAGLVERFPATTVIAINGGANNVIGGTEAGARNVLITSLSGIAIGNGATGNRVQGNYVGLRADGSAAGVSYPSTAAVSMFESGGGNLIGGTTAAARNVLSNNSQGLSIIDAAGTEQIHGNFIGTNAGGTAAIPNGTGVIVDSFGGTAPVTIGGSGAGEGNLISGNSRYGVNLAGASTRLEGNFIGTDVTGLAGLPNGASGVHLETGALIGTGTSAGRNVIAGNAGDGIEGSLLQFSIGNAISGNFIGVGIDGVTPLPNGGNGIALATTFGAGPRIENNVIAHNALSGVRLTNVHDAVIGGTSATANRIVSNQDDGVVIADGSLHNVITANSIDANGDLGIDLGDDGVTPNDPGDADSGPNALQNFPNIVRAVGGTDVIVVTGTLSSTPNTSFTIDFYASPAADPSGSGEGAKHLGTAPVVTDATGHVGFAAPVAGADASSSITATATSTAAGTSEFSNAIAMEAAGTLQFSSSTYTTAEGTAVEITVSRTAGSAGVVTFDYTTSDGTAAAGHDYVASSGTLVFGEGQTTATFTVTILSDLVPEPSETIQLALSNVTGGATVGSPSQATLTVEASIAGIPTLSELAMFALAAALALLALRSLRMT